MEKTSVVIGLCALLIGGFFLYQSLQQSSGKEPNVRASAATGKLIEKQNAKGTRSVIALADGSKVWLNADSRLQYPTAFDGTTREVYLSGEAFFDVSKNKLKPFIIHQKRHGKSSLFKNRFIARRAYHR